MARVGALGIGYCPKPSHEQAEVHVCNDMYSTYNLKPGTHWRQSRIWHGWKSTESTVSNSTLSPMFTGLKSTELNMFNFGDNVDGDTVDIVERAGDSRPATNRRQIAMSPICRRFWQLSTLSPVYTGLKTSTNRTPQRVKSESWNRREISTFIFYQTTISTQLAKEWTLTLKWAHHNRRATDHYTAIQWLVSLTLMGGLLHLVQRGGAWESCGLAAQSPPRCTKWNSSPINDHCMPTNFILFDVAL